LKVIGDCWKFWVESNEVTFWLQDLSLIEARYGKTLNIEVIGKFTSSLKRVETHNLDTGRRNHEALKLIGTSRCDFELESIFKFLLDYKFPLHDWFSKFASWFHMNVWCHATSQLYTFLTKRKKTRQIWMTYMLSVAKSHSYPWLVLSDMTYSNMVSIPIEKHNKYIYNHTSPLIPQGAPMYLTLHGQRIIHYENAFTSCRRDHKTRSRHPRCAVMASCTMDLQSLPHDRDYPQASLALRGWSGIHITRREDIYLLTLS
jgi:hypothetical protein